HERERLRELIVSRSAPLAAAPEHVGRERHVAFRCDAPGHVLDVRVQPEGFLHDDHSGTWSAAGAREETRAGAGDVDQLRLHVRDLLPVVSYTRSVLSRHRYGHSTTRAKSRENREFPGRSGRDEVRLTHRSDRPSLKQLFDGPVMRREKSNYIIQSVAHALDVLEQFFGDADRLGVTARSKPLKLRKNQSFRLLAPHASPG